MKVFYKRLSESVCRLCVDFALLVALMEALKLLEIKGHMTESVYGNLSKLTITGLSGEDGPSGFVFSAASFH